MELSELDIVVYIYPSRDKIQKIIIVNPFDNKVLILMANSFDDIKSALKELPFDIDGEIYGGKAIIVEWGSQNIIAEIYSESDIQNL